MKKFIIGFILASVMGVGVTAMADIVVGKGEDNRSVQVIDYSGQNDKKNNVPMANNLTGSIQDDIVSKDKIDEVETYIINKYGSNWREKLRELNGDEWDDVLEKELEKVFGKDFDDHIDDDDNDDYDNHDDDNDDYDDNHDDDNDDYDDDYDDDNDDDVDYDDNDDDNDHDDDNDDDHLDRD